MSEKIVLIPSRDYLCDTGAEIEPEKKYLTESGSSYVLEIKMTGAQIQTGYHSGPCDADVAALMEVPEIKSQLAEISDKALADWWGDMFVDDTEEEHRNADRKTRLAWLVFDCCANAIDGYCYETK